MENLKKQGIIQLSETIFFDTFSRTFVVATGKVTIHMTPDEYFILSKDIITASKAANAVVTLTSIIENNINRNKK